EHSCPVREYDGGFKYHTGGTLKGRSDMAQVSFDPERNPGMTRRDFMKMAIATGIVVAGATRVWPAGSQREIPKRQLGRTGEKVSCIGLGGWHIGSIEDEQESIRIMRTAIDRGLTFMDNSWDYNGGASEMRMGKALRDRYREKAFLMTKVDGRTRESAAKQID